MVGAAVTPHRHHDLPLQAPSRPEGEGACGAAQGDAAGAVACAPRIDRLQLCDSQSARPQRQKRPSLVHEDAAGAAGKGTVRQPPSMRHRTLKCHLRGALVCPADHARKTASRSSKFPF